MFSLVPATREELLGVGGGGRAPVAVGVPDWSTAV
jgi:hypothetical protein